MDPSVRLTTVRTHVLCHTCHVPAPRPGAPACPRPIYVRPSTFLLSPDSPPRRLGRLPGIAMSPTQHPAAPDGMFQSGAHGHLRRCRCDRFRTRMERSPTSRLWLVSLLWRADAPMRTSCMECARSALKVVECKGTPANFLRARSARARTFRSCAQFGAERLSALAEGTLRKGRRRADRAEVVGS